MIIDNDDYVAHFGVPGMKWGVRKEFKSGYSKKEYGKNVAKGGLILAEKRRRDAGMKKPATPKRDKSNFKSGYSKKDYAKDWALGGVLLAESRRRKALSAVEPAMNVPMSQLNRG